MDPLVTQFDPIGLAEMDKVMLQARMDTKYIFGLDKLPEILENLLPDHRILEITGHRSFLYRSLYFDTPDRKLYFAHHNGRTFRSKVRFREYVTTGTCFLEVKSKTGRGGTDKKRMPVTAITDTLDPGEQAFVARNSGCSERLAPMLVNEFSRYTLVHRTRAERLTIDRSLIFTAGTRTASLEGICVAELKEGRTGHSSPFTALMRHLVIAPTKMSKYCVGSLLLWPELKHNNFKPTMLQVKRVGITS